MSKPYRIRVQEMISVTDFSTFQIEQVPLIAPERFAEILTMVLEEAGWQYNADNVLTLVDDSGIIYSFDPVSLQIRSEISGQRLVDRDIEAWDQVHLQHDVTTYLQDQTQQLEADLAQQLETRQQQRRQQFESWVTEATGRSLKELAAELGNIQAIHEHRDEKGRYQLTISIQEFD